MSRRPQTPDRRNDDGSTTVTVKRCCNGCGREIGDVTAAELDAAMNGRPLPDVREECGCEPSPDDDAAAEMDPKLRSMSAHLLAVASYGSLGLGVMRCIAEGGSLAEVLEFVGNHMNARDHVDDESIALFERAKAAVDRPVVPPRVWVNADGSARPVEPATAEAVETGDAPRYVLDRDGDMWRSLGNGSWECLTTASCDTAGADLRNVCGPLTELVPRPVVPVPARVDGETVGPPERPAVCVHDVRGPLRQACCCCGACDHLDFRVTDEAWADVVPPEMNGTHICLRCFDSMAATRGIDYAKTLTEMCFVGDAAVFHFLPDSAITVGRSS